MDLTRLVAVLVFTGAAVLPVSPAAAACEVNVGPGLAYSPDRKTVTPGTAVEWCWEGDNHSVTADNGAFNSHPTCPPTCSANSGHRFKHTFDTVGSFEYHCQIHGGMTASIVVQASTSPTPSKSPTTRPTTKPPTVAPTTRAATTSPPTRIATPTPTTASPTTAAPTTDIPAPSLTASPTTSPAALDIDPAPAKPKTGLAIAIGLVVAAGAFGTVGWLLLRGRSG